LFKISSTVFVRKTAGPPAGLMTEVATVEALAVARGVVVKVGTVVVASGFVVKSPSFKGDAPNASPGAGADVVVAKLNPVEGGLVDAVGAPNAKPVEALVVAAGVPRVNAVAGALVAGVPRENPVAGAVVVVAGAPNANPVDAVLAAGAPRENPVDAAVVAGLIPREGAGAPRVNPVAGAVVVVAGAPNPNPPAAG